MRFTFWLGDLSPSLGQIEDGDESSNYKLPKLYNVIQKTVLLCLLPLKKRDKKCIFKCSEVFIWGAASSWS